MKKAKNHGITLIALIVTIIILLILAGTAISLLSGQNGILQRSQGAVSQYRISAARELLDLKLLEIDADSYETNLRRATFVEIVEKLRDDAEFIIVGMDLGENPIFENNLVLPEDLNSLKAIFVCSTQYKDVIFKITNEREISIYGEKVDVEIPEPGETEYQITYHKNDESGEKQVQLLDKGVETSLELNQFTRGGYTLEGWYANAECTGTKITTVSDNIEVYAKWVAKTVIESGGPTAIGGTTYADSFEIWNKPQLENFRNRVNGGEKFENCVVRQKADINLNSENWTPIGNETNYFSGIYDGEEHTIDGLYINSSNNYQGLFGYVQNGTVKNLTVDGSVTGGSGTAGIVGYINNGMINHCTNESYVTHGDVTLYWANSKANYTLVGGVCGIVEGSTEIKDSSNKGNVECYATSATASLAGGGIVGFVSENGKNVNIIKCNNSGNIKITKIDKSIASMEIGGIAGSIRGGKIFQCYNTGNITSVETNYITAYNLAGGIVGSLNNDTGNAIVAQCWNSGCIENRLAGGISGVNGGEINNCYNTGEVISNFRCAMVTTSAPVGGGICGWNQTNGKIENCYNRGEVKSYGCYLAADSLYIGAVGGIVGWNDGSSINRVYNKGKIEQTPPLDDRRGSVGGGIIGVNGNNMQNAYNTGEICGDISNITYNGGLIGWSKGVSYGENVYNIGVVSTQAKSSGSMNGWMDGSKSWKKFYWLERGATLVDGNRTDTTSGKCTSEQLKVLVSNGGLPSTDWATNPEINDGYPYLKAFDDTSIWLRDGNINGGEPYLKDNPPVE